MAKFRFVQDDDAHWYLIPDGKEQAFSDWVDAGPYWDGYEGEDFEEYRSYHPACYSVENPVEC